MFIQLESKEKKTTRSLNILIFGPNYRLSGNSILIFSSGMKKSNSLILTVLFRIKSDDPNVHSNFVSTIEDP